MADVSVRPARPGDLTDIAALQLAVWRETAQLLPAGALADVDAEQLRNGWEDAVLRPPSRRHLVLVALAGDRPAGLAAVAPSDDDDRDPTVDAELVTLLVGPAERGLGHGSRLLSAVADTAGERGVTGLTTWLFTDDAMGRAFLRSAGWEEDGATRALQVGDDEVPMVRLHTGLGG